jgi:hypothetical protein
MADTNTVQLADIIAPSAPPPAPPPYGAIAVGVGLTLIVTLVVARIVWRRSRDRRAALTLLKQAERALQQQRLDPRAAAFKAALALRLAGATTDRSTPEWMTFLNTLNQARYAPQSPSAQDAAQLLAQTRRWIKSC